MKPKAKSTQSTIPPKQDSLLDDTQAADPESFALEVYSRAEEPTALSYFNPPHNAWTFHQATTGTMDQPPKDLHSPENSDQTQSFREATKIFMRSTPSAPLPSRPGISHYQFEDDERITDLRVEFGSPDCLNLNTDGDNEGSARQAAAIAIGYFADGWGGKTSTHYNLVGSWRRDKQSIPDWSVDGEGGECLRLFATEVPIKVELTRRPNKSNYASGKHAHRIGHVTQVGMMKDGNGEWTTFQRSYDPERVSKIPSTTNLHKSEY